MPYRALQGTFAGDWQYGIPFGPFRQGLYGPFFMCTNTTAASPPNSDGVDKNLYVGGTKPAAVYLAPSGLTVTDDEDGMTYPVFTTAALEQIGLGYIVRWRTTNTWGEFGQWVRPPANWTTLMPDPSAGMPFWRFFIYRQFVEDIQGRNAPKNVLNSLNDWYAVLAARPPNSQYIFAYGAQVATRYVLIQNAQNVPGAAVLDPVTKTITLNLQTLNMRPQYYATTAATVPVNQTITITLPPTGSCTTPSVNPSTVNFGGLFASDIPNPGNTTNEKPLNLTFTNCPRMNIGYYVHANNKWVDSSTGVVGLSGSTPNAHPVIGNPNGIGVQLLHDNSIDGSGPVYISQNDDDPNKQIYWRTPAQGTNTPAGVTHSIRLRARVIRTHPADTPITVGPFNTSVIVAIQYQ